MSQVAWLSHRAQATCAVRSDGATLCWGQYQPFSSAGEGGPDEQARPRQISHLPPLARVELLLNGAVGVDRTGGLHVWRRADSSTAATAFTVPGKAPAGVTDIAAEEDYALAVTADGRAWVLGAGPLDWSAGNHPRRAWSDPPLPVSSGPGALRASAAVNHACVLTRRGTVHCIGSNSVGQLGDGTLLSHFDEATTVVQFAPEKLPAPGTCSATEELRATCLKAGPFCDLEPSPLLQQGWCRGAMPPANWRPPPIPTTSPCLCTCSQEYRSAREAVRERQRQCSMIP